MRLELHRKWKKEKYTIGRLYIDGEYFCNTLEDPDRGLRSDMTEEQIEKIKKEHQGDTAIPTGVYDVTLNIVSPKYSQKPWYKAFCGARMPRLIGVKGYVGVLIHPGNTPADTLGCVLVGKNTAVGQLTQSKATWEELYKRMRGQSRITIYIHD